MSDDRTSGEVAQAASTAEGIYLFCFTRPGAAPSADVLDVEGYRGLEQVVLGSVAALVSRVPRADFERRAEDERYELAWIEPRARLHDAVVRAAMKQSPVLPVAFGAVFSLVNVLRSFLLRHAEEIDAFLTRIAGRQEWAVKAFVDEEKARQWMMESDPAMAKSDEFAPSSPGAAYMQRRRQQVHAGKQFKDWSILLGQRLIDELKAAAEDVQPLRLYEAQGQHRMVLNCALLVEAGRVDEVRRVTEQMREEHAEQGLMIELSGPWPPYSFCPKLE